MRQSRDLRILLGGQLVPLFGTQLTAVAVPYQVYRITQSSLYVGLVSLAQLIPLLVREHRTRVLSDCLALLPPEAAGILLEAVPAMDALAEAARSAPKS